MSSQKEYFCLGSLAAFTAEIWAESTWETDRTLGNGEKTLRPGVKEAKAREKVYG